MSPGWCPRSPMTSPPSTERCAPATPGPMGRSSRSDQLGVPWFVSKLRDEGLRVPRILEAAGERPLYREEAGRAQYLTLSGDYADITRPEGVLKLADVKRGAEPIKRNRSASLWDLGDGIAGLEFHTKMNALDAESIAMVREAAGDRQAGLPGAGDRPRRGQLLGRRQHRARAVRRQHRHVAAHRAECEGGPGGVLGPQIRALPGGWRARRNGVWREGWRSCCIAIPSRPMPRPIWVSSRWASASSRAGAAPRK